MIQLKKSFEKSPEEKKTEAAAGQADAGLDLYQKIYDKVFETEPLEEGRMSETARRRAEAILQELTGPGGLEASRLSTLEPAATQDLTDGMVVCKLSFGAAK